MNLPFKQTLHYIPKSQHANELIFCFFMLIHVAVILLPSHISFIEIAEDLQSTHWFCIFIPLWLLTIKLIQKLTAPIH